MDYPVKKKTVIRKSNQFVTAKYKSSLLGSKIIALSLAKLRQDSGSEQVYAVLSPQEIRRVFGMENDQNLYKKLKAVSKKMAGNIITIEDGKGNFHTFSLVTNIDYEDNKLTVYYNRLLTPHIKELKSNYTSLDLATLISFRHSSSFRLYELLRKEAFRISEKYFTVTYGVAELRFSLGLINTDKHYITDAINKKLGWEVILEKVCKPEDIQCPRFHDFKVRVLDVAQKELKENSDISFDYEMLRGDHGRVTEIAFTIYWNCPEEEIKKAVQARSRKIHETYKKGSADDIIEITEKVAEQETAKSAEFKKKYDAMLAYLKDSGIDSLNDFTPAYFETLYRLSGNDMEEIKAEIEYGKTIPEIRNYFGWLRKAVEEGYSKKKTETLYGSEQNAQAAGKILNQVKNITTPQLEKIWERFKEKDDFPDFLASIGILDAASLEFAMSAAERINLYTKWKKGEL